MGVSHSTIINLKTNESKKYDKAKIKRRKNRAIQCIGCEHNQAGFCQDKKNWCFNAQPSCSKCVQKVPDYQYAKNLHMVRRRGPQKERRSNNDHIQGNMQTSQRQRIYR